jgi:hypothetical protein
MEKEADMKYMIITELPQDQTKKTKKFNVFNKGSDYLLGHIAWYPQWRQYCYFPALRTVFSVGCIDDISQFIKEQNEAHKKKGD